MRSLMCKKGGAALERTCRELSDDVAETVWQKVTLYDSPYTTTIKIGEPLLVGRAFRGVTGRGVL